MLIQNYGLFWKECEVFWGTPGPGRAGHLKGVLASAIRSDPVDFSDQQGVYVLYDGNFRIVYIGQTLTSKSEKRLFQRLKGHRRDQLADRWERFSWFGLRRVLESRRLSKDKLRASVKTNEVLNHLEAVLIATAEPPHNRQGGRFGNDVKQYLQYSKEDERTS